MTYDVRITIPTDRITLKELREQIRSHIAGILELPEENVVVSTSKPYIVNLPPRERKAFEK